MQTTQRVASHPRGLQIIFDPGPHDYLLDGEKLTSVTTLIHKWFPQFDAESVAKRKAERDGGCHQALMLEWERKRDDASSFGSKAHLMAEKIVCEKNELAADHLATNDRERAYLAAIKEALVRIGKAYEFIECEKIVFFPDCKVAGTIDLLLRSKITGEYVICDWKTNREIKYAGYREERGSGPCAKLANCNFIHYSLQTSTYGVLLTSEGYVPEVQSVRGVLLHLCEKNGRVSCEYVKTRDLVAESRPILAPPSAVESATTL